MKKQRARPKSVDMPQRLPTVPMAVWIAVSLVILVVCWRVSFRVSFSLVLLVVSFAFFINFAMLRYNRRLKSVLQGTRARLEGFLRENAASDASAEFLPNVEIGVLLDSVLESTTQKSAYELLQKQAQLEAMQNQINPHFLYNALDSIRGLSLEEGASGTADMVEAMSTLFRYSISHGSTLQTLEQEIENIDNYMKIQSYRFNNRFRVIKELDSLENKMFQYRLPKLTLQPMFENAIYYAFDMDKCDREPRIALRAYTTQSRLIISVSDNGTGMEESVLHRINERLASGEYEAVENNMTRKKSGIALINVNARIKLLFGGSYGLTVYSTKDVGTEVQIALPILKGGGTESAGHAE